MPQVVPIQRQNPAANIHTVSETQSNFINKRISNVERHFGLMCKGAALIARKYAKCRDAIDDLARIIVAYTETETLNLTMRNQVTHLADTLCAIADIQQNLVEVLEMKIVGGFSTYKDACKHARADLASNFRAQSRQVQLNERLEQMRAQGASTNMRQLHMAETELQRAAIEVSRTHAALEESMEYFELKKLRDLRRFFLEFCHTKIQFHARNVEIFTKAYQMIQDIKVDDDLEDFNKAMMFPANMMQRIRADTSHQSVSPSKSDVHSSGNASPRRSQHKFAAGNENSPYNRDDRGRSQSNDREPGARIRVQSKPRVSDRDLFTRSYTSANGGAARPSRSRSS